MIFVDFDILPEDDSTEERRIVRRLRPLVEAVRYALARRARVDAPFRKLVIDLANSDAQADLRPTVCLFSVGEVRVQASERALCGSEAEFRAAAFHAIRAAADRLERDLGWSATCLAELADELEQRDELCHLLLETLSKKRIPGGGKVDIWFKMTEDETSLTARLYDKSGALLAERPVASEPRPLGLDFWFDAVSTVIEGDRLLFRDRAKKVIGSLDLGTV